MDSVVTDPPYGWNFMGKKWDYDVPSVEVWKEVLRVLKPGGHILVACGTKTQHRMAVNIEDAGFEIRELIAHCYGSGFPKNHDISKAIDKVKGTEKIIGKGKAGKTALGQTSGWNKTYDSHEYNITKPNSSEAQQWEGWGTSLKPSIELWTLARKPLSEKTIVDNVLKWGTGGINIDGSRVEGKKGVPASLSNVSQHGWNTGGDMKRKSIQNGRYPANLIHDGSDEVVGLFPDSKGMSGGGRRTKKSNVMPSIQVNKEDSNNKHLCRNDSGSATRYFKTCEWQEEDYLPIYYCAKASPKERTASNKHPTVKPLKLIEYLIKLITPENGIVLDPYVGSGTTMIACKNLNKKYRYICIEKEDEYCETILERIKLHEGEKQSI